MQTALQAAIQKNTAALADLIAAAHPEAALIREREQALRDQIEKFCPPAPPKPCCHYEKCDAPKPIEWKSTGMRFCETCRGFDRLVFRRRAV